MIKDLTFKFLGFTNYIETLEKMKNHVHLRNFQNEVWILEHRPVFTLGTAADIKHIIDAKNIPVIQSDRGGEVTYHGPGQLVIYLLLDIKKSNLGPRSLITNLQKFIQSLLKKYRIDSNFIEGAPGVYVNEMKIASIGLRISNGRCYHGISINVDMDLSPFNGINPCGYKQLEVTQIKNFYESITIKQVKQDAVIMMGDLLKNST